MTHTSETDDTLVELAQGGAEAAFAALIDRNYAASLKLAHSILRDRHEAEDEVQNACWKAYQHLGQFQRDSKFSTWLSRIVMNQCLMRLRQRRRASFLYLEDGPVSEEWRSLELADERETPEEALAKEEFRRILKREIHRIPPLLRTALILRDVEELSIGEVAERLGTSISAAKSRLLRARAELRQRLERCTGRMNMAPLSA